MPSPQRQQRQESKSFLFFNFWPQPRIEPMPLAVEEWSPKHWTTREFPFFFFFKFFTSFLFIFHLSPYPPYQVFLIACHLPALNSPQNYLSLRYRQLTLLPRTLVSFSILPGIQLLHSSTCGVAFYQVSLKELVSGYTKSASILIFVLFWNFLTALPYWRSWKNKRR